MERLFQHILPIKICWWIHSAFPIHGRCSDNKFSCYNRLARKIFLLLPNVAAAVCCLQENLRLMDGRKRKIHLRFSRAGKESNFLNIFFNLNIKRYNYAIQNLYCVLHL